MKQALAILISFFLLSSIINAKTAVDHLLTENMSNPVGLDNATPRFSWQLVSEERGVSQLAYAIRLAKTPDGLKKESALLWSTGKVSSSQSVHVIYQGDKLKSDTRYYWQVKVWDQNNKASAWSEPAWFHTGFLNPSDWQAKWIAATKQDINQASPLFRKEFQLSKTIKSATLFITCHGLYEAFINNKRVGDAFFTPGWTAYNERLQYQVYDVTDMLHNGENAIGVALGKGWYRSNMGYNLKLYKNDISLLAQLEVTYKDGSRTRVISSSDWKTATGGIIDSEVYHGETYDARKEKANWASPGFDDSRWEPVVEKNYPFENLVATWNEPVRKKEVLPAIKHIITPNGDQVIDFGQNLVGWVQMKVSGKAGDQVKIYHAEVLDKDGNFYTDNLRSAKQINTYILKGEGVEFYEPAFTWQGFRYIKIEGFPGEIELDHFTAVALYSDMPLTGHFACSNELLNQLQHNIQWGQRGNFLDVPTDCPQRDERLGWTGDAQVFARTAAFNFRTNNFFAKWLQDLTAEQENGDVPVIIPHLGGNVAGCPGWSDAATIIPWTMYLAYGDKKILEDQYISMKGWVDHITNVSGDDDLWIPSWSFGDWLFYSLNDDRSGESAITDKSLIAQCFYGHSTQLLIHTAEVLGKTADVEKYSTLLKNIKAAFLREYVTRSGRMVSGTQSAYVLALHFNMLPEELQQQAAARLVDNIRKYKTHLTTGFLGTPYLCHVLTRFGYNDVAYELLLQKTYPSWLYPVTMGATTIWERWDGIKPDSTFQTPSMNSFNHYAYGAIGDWMYRTITGIDTFEEEPGYKKIRIKPQIGGDLTHASAALKTYYGKIKSSWKLENGKLYFDVEIPNNTTAEIHIPARSRAEVTEGNTALESAAGVKIVGEASGVVLVETGSGKYQFISKM